jgi:hypothetical protein
MVAVGIGELAGRGVGEFCTGRLVEGAAFSVIATRVAAWSFNDSSGGDEKGRLQPDKTSSKDSNPTKSKLRGIIVFPYFEWMSFP